jgi:hypothetical protein
MSRFDGRFRGVIVALAFFALLLPGGCGYKDQPVPPQHVVPKTVLDLQVELDEQGATLSWTYPTETVTGGKVEEDRRICTLPCRGAGEFLLQYLPRAL